MPAPISSAAAAAGDVPAPTPEVPVLGEGASVDLSPTLEGRDKALSDDEILASLSLPGSPKGSSVPIRPPSPPPTGPSSTFPRGFLWEQGLVEEVDVAFLPPRHFLGGSTSLSSDAENKIREAQLGLIRSVGYLQAYRTVRNKYAHSKAENVRLRKAVSELEPQASASEALKKELEEVKKRASSAEDELILAWNDRDEALAGLKAAKADAATALAGLKAAKADAAKPLAEKDGAFAERDAARAAVVDAEKELALSRAQVNSVADEFAQAVKEQTEALAVVTSLERKLADLTGEKLAVEEALAAEKVTSKGLADDVVQTAEACFSQALLQIQHFNPGVKLELEGYSHRAYVMADGSFIPATDDPASDADEPADGGADVPEADEPEGDADAPPEDPSAAEDPPSA